MKVYHYHPDTGVYLGSDDAAPDPLNTGQFLVPAFATTLAPPLATSSQVPVFVQGSGWSLKEDHTKAEFLWDTNNGEAHENTLKVGDPLPADRIDVRPPPPQAPGEFFMYDGSSWVHDSVQEGQWQYDRALKASSQHLEDSLKMLADNEVRKTIPNAHVLSQPNEALLKQYVVDMENYVDLVRKTGPTLIKTMGVPEPTFPMAGNPSELNVAIFDSTNPGPATGLQAKPWAAATRFEAGELVYGPNNEGLFVVPSAFTSSPLMQTDITANSLISVVPQTASLRLPPVADIAALAALPAQDYAICKVTATGDEYVFNRGAVSGDIRDNNSTGFWSLVASPSVGQYRTYNGAVVGAGTADIVVGPQPFNPNFELVFVNGSCRVDTEYSIDWTTGTITLNQAMNVNDTWKVLVMS